MDDIISKYFEDDEYSRYVNTVAFKKGQVILRPHDDTNNIYAVAKGLVKINNFDSRGNEYIAVIYGPGDFYPLAWLINRRRPPVYFQAITESKVHIIPMKIFQKHLNDNVNLSNGFMSRVIEQFAYYATTINNLGLKYGRERLYYRLLVWASKFGVKKNDLIVIPHISHSDLGITIHIARESVSKEISKLEELGVLEYNRTNITIKNPEYLQKALGKNVPIAFFDNI